MSNEIMLHGINGANPLGFLSALGTLALLANDNRHVKLAWQWSEGRWQPSIHGALEVEWSEEAQVAFTQKLYALLCATSSDPFEVDSKLPFSATSFAEKKQTISACARPTDRRSIDIVAAYGSEVISDDKGVFEATAFRMVRSGDSAGNGLPAYALEMRRNCGEQELMHTLFHRWTYRDHGPSLRWDPLEDRRYALTWTDPKKDSQNKPVMLGANVLALEALALFPAVPVRTQLRTTGISTVSRGHTAFTWPIWESLLGYDELRSVLGHSELQKQTPDHDTLSRLGIVEVFRSERVAPNQYYKNFTPAHSV